MSTNTNPRESVERSALIKNHDPARPQRRMVAINAFIFCTFLHSLRLNKMSHKSINIPADVISRAMSMLLDRLIFCRANPSIHHIIDARMM